MPLPLIPIIVGIAALGTGTYGIGKGVKAVVDNNEANDVNERAKDIIDDAKKSLESARDKSKKALENLGNKKLYICEQPLGRFIRLFEQVKNIEFRGSAGLGELAKFKIDKQSFSELKEINLMATSFAGGSLSGAVAGGAVAFGAYSAAGTFAAASTGTAIAGLSGAAATNATLAFFGGGSLAVGGLGIAGGTIVLGGLVAGPALAVLGVVMGAKASSNLDNAYSNLSMTKQAAEEIRILVTACNGIRQRANLFTRVLIKLDLLLYPMLDQFENIIKNEGVDYKGYSRNSKRNVAALLSTVQAVKAMIDTPILDKDGKLTAESKTVAAAVAKQLEM